MKRCLVALTPAQMGQLRSIAQVTVETSEPTSTAESASLRKLAEAVAAIDRAELVDTEDFRAYDYAAGSLLNDGAWKDYTRGTAIKGSPFKARAALVRIMARSKP